MVTGSPQPVPLDEADRDINVLGSGDMPELFRSWADYLHLTSTVDLQQRAPGGMQADISIRGAQFGQTLVLVNGIRVNDAQTGHHNLDVPLPLEMIDRMEILNGAGSTLYGSDAVGGAVNFITPRPRRSEISLGAAVGNFGINQQDASASFVRGNFSQQLSFARDFSSGFMPDRDYRGLALASTTRTKSRLGHSSVLLAHGDRPFGADQFYGKYNSWERTKTWFASLQQDLGEQTQVAFAYRRHTDNFILFRDRPQVYANAHATENWQLALRRRTRVANNATLFYGGEGYRDRIDSNNLGHHQRNRAAGYVNLDVRALRRFSFAVGLRDEIWGDWRHELSPTVSGGAWLSPRLKLRGAVSHAFRLPSYTDLYYRDPATRGNPDLRPETAWSYEAGADFDPAGRLSGAATVFHRRERAGIDYVRYVPGGTWTAANIDTLRFTGLELALRAQLPKSVLQVSYAWLHVSQVPPAVVETRYVGNFPLHNAVISWQGRLAKKFLGRTRVGVVQRSGRDAYGLWDVALTRRFKYVAPYVQVSNLTDTSYQEIPGVAMPGRTAVVGLRLNFPARD